MNIEYRQWYFNDEPALIKLLNEVDRSQSDIRYPAPGKCEPGSVLYLIQRFVGMPYNGEGTSRAITVDGNIVGHIEINLIHDLYQSGGELSIFLHPEACGNGIACQAIRRMTDYAFQNLNYEYVITKIPECNKAAIKVMEKAGFVHHDNMTTEVIINGRPCNILIYGYTRPKRETTKSGVEIRPWMRRDIDRMAHILDTFDRRFDDVDIEKPCSLNYCAEYVDHYNIYENVGRGMSRAIIHNGKIVGLIVFTRHYGKRSIDGTIGYLLAPEACGKGIATKAVTLAAQEIFEKYSVSRITAKVYAPNRASARVLEKNGFQLEGTMRNAVMCEGEPTDYLIYGLIRKESNN